VGFDGSDGGMAFLGFDSSAVLAFSAAAGGIGSIATFRSGAFGDVPDVRTGVDLGGATLEIDLSDLVARSGQFRLLAAEELIGSFAGVTMTGLAGGDAETSSTTMPTPSGSGSPREAGRARFRISAARTW
jgi:hypothetical protein